jgi:hypothetical protein
MYIKGALPYHMHNIVRYTFGFKKLSQVISDLIKLVMIMPAEDPNRLAQMLYSSEWDLKSFISELYNHILVR